MSKQSHIERTANEPRDASLHTLTISRIDQVTPTICLFRLAIPPSNRIDFLPGQWVDLYLPPSANIPKPGGFTITSPPSLALPPPPISRDVSSSNDRDSPSNEGPYIELAIQRSPQNPPAAYLFQPCHLLLGSPVQIRIGGSFVFPPSPWHSQAPSTSKARNSPKNNTPPVSSLSLRKVVFVAGGVGINPLMSMLSSIGELRQSQEGQEEGNTRKVGEVDVDLEVRVLYSVKDPLSTSPGDDDTNDDGHGGGCGIGNGDDHAVDGGSILFLDRILGLFASGRVKGGLELFITGGRGSSDGQRDVLKCGDGAKVPFLRRRMTVRDVDEAVGKDKDAAVVYVCGPPAMTDEFVEGLVSPERSGLEERRVLFEKWW